MSKAVREVTIGECSHSWLVAYRKRQPGQRYRAALFHKSVKTRDEVVQWVKSQPHLSLKG